MTKEEELILGFPKEMKLQILKEAMEEKDLSVAFGLAKILLDAPINKGGIATEEINEALNQ
jgi:hypothetical protein